MRAEKQRNRRDTPICPENTDKKVENMKEQVIGRLLSQKQLAENVYSMWIEAAGIAGTAVPGQFVSVYCKDGARLLPRPVSICEVSGAAIRLVYRVAGAGTAEFSDWEAGEEIRLQGPLGNGFPLRPERAILIGGGIGIPPMLELAKRLPGEKTIVAGYRDDQLFLYETMKQYAPVAVATEDGSAGTKGTVLDAIREQGVTGQVIYACGPTPMLRAVKAYALEQKIVCYVSLEERMACGIGACLACVCRSREVDAHTGVHNKRICKDGPVFLAQEVDL